MLSASAKFNCGIILLLILVGQILPESTIVASMKTNPLVVLGFNRCAGAPCFLGVIPGKTSWRDTTTILLSHNFTKTDSSDLAYSRFEPNDPFQIGIYVYRVPDKPSVTHAVDLSDPHFKYQVTLADLLALYGFPCKVEREHKGSFWFVYPDILAHTYSESEPSYSTTAPIDYLHLLDPQVPITISGITYCDKVQYTKEYLLWFTF